MKSKKLASLFLTAFMVVGAMPLSTVLADETVAINTTNFPDPVFRSYVSENCDTNSDGQLSKTEIQNVTVIQLPDNRGIESIKGVEYFTNVGLLSCGYNKITSIDVSNLTSLYELDCSSNQLTTLDVSKNAKLLRLECGSNQLTSLDLSKNINLRILHCWDNKLTTLNIAYNTKMEALFCEKNQLASLDVSRMSHLNDLICYGNNLKSISLNPNASVVAAFKTEPESKVFDGYSFLSYHTVYNDLSTGLEVDNNTQVSVASAQDSETGVAGFVERLYTVALRRDSDPKGKENWINLIRNGKTGAEAAKGFLFSEEFLSMDMSEYDFVEILYEVFFNREADADGLRFWVNELYNGQSKQTVIMGFINSTEWANVCLKYGINSGGTGTANIEVEPNDNIIAFTTRLYTTCLNREPDQDGLMRWARMLANLEDSGSNVAHGFFFSSEFTSQALSDDEYVTRLYRTFMDREPDAAGKATWIGQLNSGVSREAVFQGFAQSEEFGKICADYGIIR